MTKKVQTWLAAFLYTLAIVNVMQYYVVYDHSWLDPVRYLQGKERLPFQERVFPIPILKAFNHIEASSHYLSSGKGVFTGALFAPFCLSLISFAIASIFVVLLYRAASRRGTLSTLVGPVFLTLTVSTYILRSSAAYFYPYDMPALAFFSAAYFFLYRGWFSAFYLVFLFGTFDRETTLFLVPIFVLDALAPLPGRSIRLLTRVRGNRILWHRVALLSVTWLAIKISLVHRFAANDHQEQYIRFGENLHRLSPRLWPTLLDMCGYLLPIVYLGRESTANPRIATWLLVVPIWVIVMFFTGVLTETRIYGELLPLVSVAAMLMLEEHFGEANTQIGTSGSP